MVNGTFPALLNPEIFAGCGRQRALSAAPSSTRISYQAIDIAKFSTLARPLQWIGRTTGLGEPAVQTLGRRLGGRRLIAIRGAIDG
jgi:hypothetical protein